MKSIPSFVLVIAILFSAHSLFAQSPRLITTGQIGTTSITIEYGSPSKKGRLIFGGVVPFDQLWRTGANTPTYFTCDKHLAVGDNGGILYPGKYTIVTQPGDFEWDVYFLSDTMPFVPNTGAPSIDISSVKARITVPALQLPGEEAYENLTFRINALVPSYDMVDLLWDKTKVSIPVYEVVCLMRINSNLSDFPEIYRHFGDSFLQAPQNTYARVGTAGRAQIHRETFEGEPREYYQVKIGSDINANIVEQVENFFRNHTNRVTIVRDTENAHVITVGD